MDKSLRQTGIIMEDGLPVIRSDPNREHTIWHLPDLRRHRAVGPAYIERFYYFKPRDPARWYKFISFAYHFDGRRHRHPKSGPAIKFYFENGERGSEEGEDVYAWFGIYHRPDGPAKGREYMFNGRRQCRQIALLGLTDNCWATMAANLNAIVTCLFLSESTKLMENE